jgi:hypothetical protein
MQVRFDAKLEEIEPCAGETFVDGAINCIQDLKGGEGDLGSLKVLTFQSSALVMIGSS